MPPCGRLRLCLVDGLLEGVPGERGAFDPHRNLYDSLQGFEVTETDAFEVGGEVAAVSFAFELRLVDRHERLERADEPAHLVERLAAYGCPYARGGCLADRTALTLDLDVAHRLAVVVDVEIQHDLVAAQRIEAFDLVRGRDRELAPIPRRTVVIEDDLPVEVFEPGHVSDPTTSQISKNFWALASASTRASTSAWSLYT